MNIFASSPSPHQSALWLDDRRVIKMAVETAQLLSTAVFHADAKVHAELRLYKPAYDNHPCTLWAREGQANFDWLVDHGLLLTSVYHETYKKQHASEDILLRCLSCIELFKPSASDVPLSFVDCTPFKDVDMSIHGKYKKTLSQKWIDDKQAPTWKGRDVPEWFKKEVNG